MRSEYYLVLAMAAVQCVHGGPWIQTFLPLRQLHVAPGGRGPGTRQEPLNLDDAIETAQPGDLFWLSEGIYKGTYTLSRPGRGTDPIVFRAEPGQRVTVQGKIVITGANNWVCGVEVTDPGAGKQSGPSGSIYAGAPGVHLINNVIHDTWEIGIGGWSTGRGHVYYGNIIYRVGMHENPDLRGYPIYAQNDYCHYGYKYVIQNVLLDARPDIGGPAYNFHAYGKEGGISGFYLSENVMRSGTCLIGGYGAPAVEEEIVGNYFYDNPVELGYRRPAQVEFRDNYLGRTPLIAEWFWGEGETVYEQSRPNVFSGNEIYCPPPDSPHLKFRTSAYLYTGRCEGCSRIRTEDLVDRNIYSRPFRAAFFADGRDLGVLDLAHWRAATAKAGNAFDTNSTEIEVPEDRIIVLPNEYERGRGHVVIYNWSRAASAQVELSAVVAPGASYRISEPKDAFGYALASGTYTPPARATIATGGSEFLVLLLTSGAPDRRLPAMTALLAPSMGGLPKISDVKVSSITPTSALITWTTDDYTSSQVEYGPGSSLGSASPADKAMVRTHSVTLTGLTSNSTYRYRTRSCVTDAVCAASSMYSFTTAAGGAGVTIAEPRQGQSVAGSIRLTAAVSGKVARLAFLVDGKPAGKEISSPPFQTDLDTLSLANGPHAIAARAWDASSHASTSQPVEVTVTNGARSGPVRVFVEAESGAITGPMSIQKNPTAAEGRFVVSRAANGTASYNVNLPGPGDYVVWCRVLGTQGSFRVSVDGSPDAVCESPALNGWQWVRGTGHKFPLGAGKHTFRVRTDRPGAGLDRLGLTNDPNFTPR